MDKLTAALKIALANTFVMYFKSQSYHWNVEGFAFAPYHDFFGEVYNDLYGAVDPLAEHLRKLDVYAPVSLMELYGYKTITEDSAKPVNIHSMLSNLLTDNTEIYNALSTAFDMATELKVQGLADYLASRMDAHKKTEWQIKASLKNLGD